MKENYKYQYSNNYYTLYFACAPNLTRISDTPGVRVYHRVKYRPSRALALRNFLYTKLGGCKAF